ELPGVDRGIRRLALRGVEQRCRRVALRDERRIVGARGEREVRVGEYRVLRDAGALGVRDAEFRERGGLALRGGLAEPGDRRRDVRLDAGALRIREAEVVLGRRVARIGRLANPACGFRIVLRRALAERVDLA